MNIINEWKEKFKTEKISKIMLETVMGYVIAFSLFFLFHFSILHEYLHVVPFLIIGYPVIISNNFLIYLSNIVIILGKKFFVVPLFNQWFVDLCAMMPYLVSSVFGLGLLVTGFMKKSLFLLVCGTYILSLTLIVWLIGGWHEWRMFLV